MGLERIGRAVGRRQVSAVELVRRSLERIEQLDGELHAVVALHAEQALEEAAALDRRAARRPGARPAGGRSPAGQGHRGRGRHADHLRLAAVPGRAAGGLIGRRPIPDWIDLSTDGPLATSVEDLRLLLAIADGYEPFDL